MKKQTKPEAKLKRMLKVSNVRVGKKLHKELEFQIIKEQLDVSDSVLSKHLKVLEDANYVQLIKKTEFTRQRTWVSLTTLGRTAFKNHLKELKSIIGTI